MAIQQRLTLEEFLRLPERKPALEFVDGVVEQKVSPKGPHGRLQAWLAGLLERRAGAQRLGAVFSEARVTIGGQSLVPDLVYYAWDRIPRATDGRVAEDFVTPPDAVVEILSPGQRVNVVARCCRWYLEQGVPLVLLVDPKRERVTVFRPDAEPTLVAGDEPIDFEPALPGLQITGRELFDALYFR